MAKTTKRVISLLLAVVLVVGTFAGCGKSNKEETAAITATAVKYTKSGQYTTTVSSKKVDLSGISADNVEVRYFDPTADPEAAEAESTEAATEEVTTEATTEPTEEIKLEDVYPLSAKVESVKAADKKSYEITFTDDKAAEYITADYIVLFKGVEGDYNTADVAVEFPEITLTPDVENVVSDATQAKVTLAIDGSTFEDGISEKDIYLDNAFSDMKIESVSSSDTNLTVQLKGTPVKNAAGAYQWGSVNVKPSGIKDGYADVTSKVDIKLASAYIDVTTLKFENGKINADLKVYGVVDINTLTKDNIKIDGATVEAAEKADDNTVKLTIAADGVKSVNDFADLFGENAMKLGDYETTVSVSQASFYPVFDYVEEDGDNLKITLKLFASNGSFDKNLKADAITFADGFADAKIDSLKIDDDTTATLIIAVPANGATAETVDVKGTVNLAKGSLISKWGEAISKTCSYTRSYTNESLGRADFDDWTVVGSTNVTLNGDTLLEIQKYTRGLNTTFGKVCYYAGIAGQVFSIGKTILEATGVLQSDQDKIMEQFSAISGKLDDVLTNQYKIMDMLNTIDYDVIETANDTYRENLDDLKADVKLQEDLFKLGAMYMALEDAVAEGKLEKMPRQDKFDDYEEYLPNVDDMTDEELEAYNNRLVDYMINRCEDSTDPVFDDFKTSYESLKKDLGHVADKLARTDATNPITRYDTLCSMKYNFDSQCYGFRFAQRATASDLLSRGMMIVFLHEKVMTYPKELTFINLQKRVESAAKFLDESYDLIGHPASEVKNGFYPFSYVFGKNVYVTDSKNLPSCNDFGSAIKQFSGSRSWSADEKRTLIGRIQASSLEEEFKSAGLDISNALLLTFGSKKHTVQYNQGSYAVYYDYSGEVIETGNKTTSNANLGKRYTHNDYGRLTDEKYKDVTFITLTDYDRDPKTTVLDPKNPSVAYQAHVQDIGWQPSVLSNENNVATAGTTGQGNRLEALQIFLADGDGNSVLEYRAHVQDVGWQNWVDSSTDGFAGTTGQNKRIEAVEIKLKDEYADKYDIVYRAHMQDHGWLGWVKNGQTAGITGQSLRMEAIEIKLVKK